LVDKWKERLFVEIEESLVDEDVEKLFLYGALEQLVQTLKNERHWHGTSKVGHVENLQRNKELGHEHMFFKFFAPSPIYMVKSFSSVNIGQIVNFL
jgi:hypothetical protein